jgi:hypothetical protein
MTQKQGKLRSPRRRELEARQAHRWAMSSGPVVVRFVDPEEVRPGRPLPPLETKPSPVRALRPKTAVARLRSG